MSTATAISLKTSHNIKRAFDPFLVVCSPSNLAQAVHALYYLPDNYSLMVMSDSMHKLTDTSWMDNLTFKHRIQFNEKETAESASSLFAFADAVIGNEQEEHAAHTPRVVVSATTLGLTPTADGFTVQTDNPEALASALLSLARN